MTTETITLQIEIENGKEIKNKVNELKILLEEVKELARSLELKIIES